MCTNPSTLEDGRIVACRNCQQCKEAVVLDWTGRLIAEQRTSKASHFLTLTYGRDTLYNSPDHEDAAVLNYSHVQDFFKRLRYYGHRFRYFVVGEYGDKKGRAHWHMAIYWLTPPPEDVLEHAEKQDRWNWDAWPHGFSQFKKLVVPRMRYLCKYLHKDMLENGGQSYSQASKLPHIGRWYFRDLAKKWVDNGLAPQDRYYSFPESFNSEGVKMKYFLRGATLEWFLADFVRLWEERYPGRHLPHSDLLELFLDRCDRRGRNPKTLKKEALVPFNASEERKRLKNRPAIHRMTKPWIKPPGWDDYSYRWLTIPFSGVHNTFVVWYDLKRYFWRRDNGGEWKWTTMIEGVSGVGNDGKRTHGGRSSVFAPISRKTG